MHRSLEAAAEKPHAVVVQRVLLGYRIYALVSCGLLWLLTLGCTRYRDDLTYDHPVEYSWSEPGTPGEFTLFEGVAWDGAVGPSASSLIATQSLVDNRNVLDLFSGPGVVAVLCAYENPKRVLSLAESDIAAACTQYNLASHQHEAVVKVQRFESLASPGLIASDRFDIILTTLSITRDDGDDGDDGDGLPTSERIKTFLHCVDNHLALSGRAFAICESGATLDMLTAACEDVGKEMVPATSEPTRWHVFEIRSSSVQVNGRGSELKEPDAVPDP